MITRSRRALLSASLWQTIGTTILIAWLLLVANVLFIWTWNTQQVRDYVQPKLGMYFYVTQWVGQEVDNQTAVSLIEELKEAWIETTFFSKEQAFKRLTAQVPDVIQDLEKYGIDNPLPATIYVTFDWEEEFQVVKSIVMRYEELIANSNDLTKGVRFSTQEKRIQTALNMMRWVQWVWISLIVWVVIVILAFVRYSCVLNVTKFREQVDLEKLLWSPMRKILAPFVLHIAGIIVLAFLFFVAFGTGIVHYFAPALQELFGLSLSEFAIPWLGWWKLLLIERWVLLVVALSVSIVVLWKLIGRKH